MKLILEAIKSMFRKIEAQRTHYDTRETKTAKYTFDGNLEEKEAVYIGSGAYYVKLSDEVFPLETYIGWEMTRNDGSKISVLEDSIYEYSSGCYAVEEYTFAVIVPESANLMGVTLGKGVWLFYYPGYNYVESMSRQYVTGELKRLDEKYLPEGVSAERIDEVLNVADTARSTADSKMDKKNPVGTGSFSINRRIGSHVGDYSTAMGFDTTASSNYSAAIGRGTMASGYCSTAMGNNTTASGDFSIAMGSNTTAQRKSQHVQGEFNLLDTHGSTSDRGKYAHIVGNGTSYTARSNAHTLDWNGLGWFAGGLKVGGTGQDDANAKEVATKEDKLPNPNALTFSGAVEGTYDGSAPLTVEIPTDAHINNLINTALGVIENGTY